MSNSPTFAERILILHEALDSARIGHGFGGAVALAYYVEEPRATRDVDVNVCVPTDESARVLAAMPTGVAVPDAAGEVVGRDGQIRLWWDGESGIPVDIFFPQHAFHGEVEQDIHPVPFLGTEIPVISATHLTVFKALFNRPRDWPDISAMLQAGSVDTEAALGWVERLLGPESAPYERLTVLARSSTASGTAGAHGEGELPVVDWDTLGS
ncbi:MAG TPA: hypothetical protein VFW24_17625 [Acidimicrobiales bacterium]|nr:hypothetical protein [Acidimicrobiales bacterium]